MAISFGATMAIMIFITFLVGGGVYYFVYLKIGKLHWKSRTAIWKNCAACLN